jgi:multidrug efflux pump subunit AcrB/outer membrane protein TolC
MNPIRWALAHRQVVFVLTAFAVLLGLNALVNMPRREDPKITIRAGLVLAAYPGATAAQVERQVTRPIEERLFRHEEVRKAKTYATSADGGVIVRVELEEWVKDPDRFWAMLRHDLNELRATGLPAGVQGPVVNSNFGDVSAVLLAVRGERYTPRELKDYLDRIEDAIRTLPEVSQVSRAGEQREELRVEGSNARLAEFGVTPAQVAGALRARNAVQSAGEVETASGARVPVRTGGLLGSEAELRGLLVGTSRDGRPVYLGDLATVRRGFAEDPSLKVRVDGQTAVLLSVEMQEGNNIVRFGADVRRKLEEVRRTLPPDLRVELVADQPGVVRTTMFHLGREFAISLAAVILVTMLLLPVRVAAIAAVAIPVTVAITLALLETFGIELHRMSFAGLLVALGIVVDDAIVVADNYVEKLDHGMSPWEAAWRSPTELVVPVLAATLTIVASFLPLAFLNGTAGEYVRAMPLTVTISLLTSFAVAMLLTPILCYLFAKTGLHAPAPAGARPKRRGFSPLDAMQGVYERALRFAMPRKRLTLAAAVGVFVAGLALLASVKQSFFPFAERDQFVVDVWMPEGTRLDGTDAVVGRLERALLRTEGVVGVASFVGGSAPRFVATLDPEFPARNYGQLVVRTAGAEETPRLVARLHQRLNALAPEAQVFVKQIQQGPPLRAPIEVRLIGDDMTAVRHAGEQVAGVLQSTPGSEYVHTDWREDVYGLTVDLREEVAGRLGITDADVAQQLQAGLRGAPLSTFWEGSRPVDIVFSLAGSERGSLDDVASAYVVSPVTGARVPVRQVADVRTEWEPGRLVRRNGLRTLTVRASTQPGVLASEVLNAARPRIAALALPAGVRTEYGGMFEASAETQGSVNRALAISMVAIFLILLFQFRNVRMPLVVMVSIPLALVGAGLGLVLTHNAFTYTANIGVNALAGVVVRNAIILVGYANELRAQGEEIEAAARDAGRRRLRPVFLTTMAAAVGVIPLMVFSRFWSPMASVLAVGLVCSMVFTLVVVPVLYVVVERRAERKALARAGRDGAAVHLPRPALVTAGAAMLALSLLAGSPVLAQSPGPDASGRVAAGTGPAVEARRLTLDEAVEMALRQGTGPAMAAARVRQARAHQRVAQADYLPQLSVTANLATSDARARVTIPQGALGEDGAGRPLPFTDRAFEQGGGTAFYTTATVRQPLTQLVRVRQANRLAQAQARQAEAEAAAVRADVGLAVERLYLGVLIARRQREAAAALADARRRGASDASGAARAGTVLVSLASDARAGVAEAEYALLTASNRAEDLQADLVDLLGLPPGTTLDLATPAPAAGGLQPLAAYLGAAAVASPEVRAADARVEQAQRGVALARAEWIPDVGVAVSHTYQDALPFLPRNTTSLTVQGSWAAWDWGKRSAAVRERRAGAELAMLAAARVRDSVAVEVQQAWRDAERAEQAVGLARTALEARREGFRVADTQAARGIIAVALRSEAAASLSAAEARMLEAELGVRVARAQLARLAGTPPP